MKRYSRITPQGSRDFLFEECDDRRKVERTVTELFKENNYRKVMTPTIEYFDVFREEIGTTPANDLYKFFDREGG